MNMDNVTIYFLSQSLQLYVFWLSFTDSLSRFIKKQVSIYNDFILLIELILL